MRSWRSFSPTSLDVKDRLEVHKLADSTASLSSCKHNDFFYSLLKSASLLHVSLDFKLQCFRDTETVWQRSVLTQRKDKLEQYSSKSESTIRHCSQIQSDSSPWTPQRLYRHIIVMNRNRFNCFLIPSTVISCLAVQLKEILLRSWAWKFLRGELSISVWQHCRVEVLRLQLMIVREAISSFYAQSLSISLLQCPATGEAFLLTARLDSLGGPKVSWFLLHTYSGRTIIQHMVSVSTQGSRYTAQYVSYTLISLLGWSNPFPGKWLTSAACFTHLCLRQS